MSFFKTARIMSNIQRENKRTGKGNVVEVVDGLNVSTYTENRQQIVCLLSVNEQDKWGKRGRRGHSRKVLGDPTQAYGYTSNEQTLDTQNTRVLNGRDDGGDKKLDILGICLYK